MTGQEMREKFEREYVGMNLSRVEPLGEDYVNHETQIAWCGYYRGYQAAAATYTDEIRRLREAATMYMQRIKVDSESNYQLEAYEALQDALKDPHHE